ncbi:endonuclease/exonuclease/phosphatase family protein [uncultured Polaribacter sp.]|uniref:endonuclease/exonuclease/phosphatase family protein n=1 Tax=uncultured Polaribacter sp. TaxID=174711 RepID=UPI00262B8B91|nr:endonuclease/exonuclease/phosphatase family protein [uncultured Polaribacter sp.]
MFLSISSKNQSKKITTIGFYNVENLFDTKDNPNTLDDAFTQKGKKQWSHKRYRIKIKKLGSVISQMGLNRSKFPPAIVGLVEVENANVVEDLVNSSNLRKFPYGFAHYDSPDERGIDVALLYNKHFFEYLNSKTHPVYLKNEEGKRDYTRDILEVTGNLHGELIHVLVNHWSSRRAGQKETEPKRIIAAETVKSIVANIRDKNFDAKIIIMGDFNDDPTSKSVKLIEKAGFINPMISLWDKESSGTLTYSGKWNLFDQILFSENFKEKKEGKLYLKHAEVFNKEWLKNFKGKLKGSPFRTYIGKWYQGGFSDHFPVYAFLKKKD